MTQFFSSDQLDDIGTFFAGSYAYEYSPARPHSDFRHFSDLSMAAELLQQPQRRDEILGWALDRLVDTERIENTAARTVLFRNYTGLVLDRPVDDLEDEWTMSLLREELYFPAEQALAHMMMVVALTRNGELTRRIATSQLERTLRKAEGGWRDRVQTCFYALHVQSAFPDVLDQVIPPFPTSASELQA